MLGTPAVLLDGVIGAAEILGDLGEPPTLDPGLRHDDRLVLVDHAGGDGGIEEAGPGLGGIDLGGGDVDLVAQGDQLDPAGRVAPRTRGAARSR